MIFVPVKPPYGVPKPLVRNSRIPAQGLGDPCAKVVRSTRTALRFDGTLLAWAQRPVRVLVPPGFVTAFEALVNRPQDFVCRGDFRAKIKQREKGGLYVFTYAGDGTSAPERFHLRSEHSTVVVDTSSEKSRVRN